MSDEERPVHVVIDCSPPEPPEFDEEGNLMPVDAPPRVIEIPVTDEEWDARKTAMASAAQQEAADLAETERLRELVAAHPDELTRELARRAGLLK